MVGNSWPRHAYKSFFAERHLSWAHHGLNKRSLSPITRRYGIRWHRYSMTSHPLFLSPMMKLSSHLSCDSTLLQSSSYNLKMPMIPGWLCPLQAGQKQTLLTSSSPLANSSTLLRGFGPGHQHPIPPHLVFLSYDSEHAVREVSTLLKASLLANEHDVEEWLACAGTTSERPGIIWMAPDESSSNAS